jgi:AcrR family transcriptional regulator
VKGLNTNNASKESILDAVLKHISETGSHHITIREIGRLANVNSAAISYYFGSKDALIHEACKYYYDIASKIFDELRDGKSYPRERLKQFFIAYTGHMLRYPGFLKVQISQYIGEEIIRTDVGDWTKRNIEILKDTIREAVGVEDNEILFFKSLQFLSCMVYPYLLNKYVSSIGEVDLADEALREKYVNTILDGI